MGAEIERWRGRSHRAPAIAPKRWGWYPWGMTAKKPNRVVTDSMLGMELPDIDRWSELVTVVLGQNPGPFTGPGTNTYLIGRGPKRILLDTGQGVPSYLDILERAITETEGVEGLERIVITHAHPDHNGGVRGIFERLGRVPVNKMPRVELDQEVEIDAVQDGCVVRTDGATLRGIWTPGHACDHLCFYLEEERALFTGDVVLGAGTTVIPGDGDLGDYMNSLERILALDMDVIYPAHGPAIREPHKKVRAYIAHRELRDEQIESGLEKGPTTIADLVAVIYVDVPEFLHPAAQVSVNAHLRRMESRGIAERDGEQWRLC